MLEEGNWYSVTLLPLTNPAWEPFLGAVAATPAMLGHIATGDAMLVRSLGGDPIASVLFTDGTNGQIPQAVVDVQTPVAHETIMSTTGSPIEFVKMGDGTSAFLFTWTISVFDVANTTTLIAGLT